MNVPRVLAIDFGKTTGWAANMQEGVVCSIKILPDKQRERAYCAFIRSLIATVKPDVVFYETIKSLRQHRNSCAQAHWWGFYYHELLHVCSTQGILTEGVHSTTIKKHAGHGQLDKNGMIRAAVNRGYTTISDDAADALWLLLYVLENKLVEKGG